MSEPPISRNFAMLLISLAAIVLAIPFVDRNDWQGWVAFFVSVSAATWIVGTQLLFAARTVREWLAGRDLD